jgi:integrase
VNLDLTVLKAMLQKALEWGQLAEHPGKTVKLLKNPNRKTRFLSEEEEASLLSPCSPALRRAIEIGLLTGFRRRESVSLQPEDVDLERGMVSVAACYAKNGESRTLPLGPRLKALLCDALAARGNAPTVLVNEHGRPWAPDTLSAIFREICETIQIGSLGPQVLRHTFGSRLAMARVDLRTVQELMGHKSIAMTMRYAHLSPDHKRAAMGTLERRFSGKSPANCHNAFALQSSEEYMKAAAIR